MAVLPMVWASFLSRTWPGVGGALMYRANEPMVHAKLAQLSLLWCWPLPPGWRGPPVELALLQDRYGGWHRIDSRTALCLRRLTHGAIRGGG